MSERELTSLERETRRTSFQLHILKRMSPTVRQAALQCLGLSPDEAEKLEATCPIRIPTLNRIPISAYEDLLGHAVVQRTALGGTPPGGAIEHMFVLPLWPHLFWTVREAPSGAGDPIGFENQHRAPPRCLEPASFRPELVTLRLLKHVAQQSATYDGWDEDVIVHFDFPEGRFEGHFVWDLLQEWRRLPTAEADAAPNAKPGASIR
ncbi:MAG: hypothetical protein KF819_13950 [Labilithrix sp.]|nr:hypothetical protein [Labilithrix sp.]